MSPTLPLWEDRTERPALLGRLDPLSGPFPSQPRNPDDILTVRFHPFHMNRLESKMWSVFNDKWGCVIEVCTIRNIKVGHFCEKSSVQVSQNLDSF